MHEKQAKITKIRAPMIRSFSFKQLTIAEFDWPFQTDLDENNRWVKMSQCIPWDELAEFYYQELSAETGRPAKDARMVIGAVIIKHKFCLSDVETVLQIQENPYMQYFVGLAGFQMEKPFASSLFVEIRKRMGRSVFEGFHQVIIEAHDGEKEKIESKLENQKKFQPKSQDEHGDYSSTVSEDDDGIQKEVPTHQGKLIDWNWNEDRCSISKGYGPENITCLRRFATELIKSIFKDSVSSTIKKLARNVRRVFECLRMTDNSRKIICQQRSVSFRAVSPQLEKALT